MIKSPKLPDATHLVRRGLGGAARVASGQVGVPGSRYRILCRRPVVSGEDNNPSANVIDLASSEIPHREHVT